MSQAVEAITAGNTLLEAASAHGDEEGSDAQIGDLADLFNAAYILLTDAQREEFFADAQVYDMIQTVPEYAAACVAIYGKPQEPDDGR